MILSFHPVINGHVSRICADREINETDRHLMGQASAVLLPQNHLPRWYTEAVRLCGRVFPDYTCRYDYPGKTGDIRLFRCTGLPHPETDIFHRLSECPDGYWERIRYPVVIKHSCGGEGHMVYPVNSPDEVRAVLARFREMEKSGLFGFLVQQKIITDQRTLRVVVMHDQFHSYWRIQPDSSRFRHNAAQGGEIDSRSDRNFRHAGIEQVKRLCFETGINLAGIDVLFDHSRPEPAPLFLEVNYYFGRKGLGGSDRYYSLLKQAVDRWLAEHNLCPPD